MNRQNSVKFLKHLGAKVPAAQNRGGWIVSECPLGPWRHANGKSLPEVFGVQEAIGDSRVHCFSCGYHGTQTDLIFEMKHLNKLNPQGSYEFGEAQTLVMQAEEQMDLAGLDTPDIEEVLFGEAGTEDHIFADWWFSSFPRWRDVKFARDYMETRGIPAEVCDYLDIRADTEQERVCFPIRDFNGELRGLHGRAVKDGIDPRYRMYKQGGANNPMIWFGEHWVNLDKPIIVVEGPLDLAKVLCVYRNVVSPLFSNPNYLKIKRMSDAMEVFTLLDRGSGGDHGRERFKNAMKHSLVTNLLPPEEHDDAGAMPIPALAEFLKEYVPLDKIIL